MEGQLSPHVHQALRHLLNSWFHQYYPQERVMDTNLIVPTFIIYKYLVCIFIIYLEDKIRRITKQPKFIIIFLFYFASSCRRTVYTYPRAWLCTRGICLRSTFYGSMPQIPSLRFLQFNIDRWFCWDENWPGIWFRLIINKWNSSRHGFRFRNLIWFCVQCTTWDVSKGLCIHHESGRQLTDSRG